jgi:hypothetical protein
MPRYNYPQAVDSVADTHASSRVSRRMNSADGFDVLIKVTKATTLGFDSASYSRISGALAVASHLHAGIV